MALLLASLAAGAYVDSVARELHALEAELLSLERDTVPDKCFQKGNTLGDADAALAWESGCEKQTTNKMLLCASDSGGLVTDDLLESRRAALCDPAKGDENRRIGAVDANAGGSRKLSLRQRVRNPRQKKRSRSVVPSQRP